MISKVLILVFVVATAQCKDWHGFMRKYATAKILGECFGSPFMTEWHRNFTNAVKYCESQSSEDELKNFPLNEYPVNDVTFEQTFPADSIFQGQPDPSLAALSGSRPEISHNLASALRTNITQPILLVPLPLPLLKEISDLTTGNFLLRKEYTFFPWYTRAMNPNQ